MQVIFGQNSPISKFDGKYVAALVDCILKNSYYILKKDCTYDIKVRPYDWSLATEKLLESMNSGEYPLVPLPYKEFDSVNDFCRAFHFDYSMEQGKTYISSTIDNQKIILNGNLKHVLVLNKI